MVSCRSCGADELDVFLSLGELPLSDGFLKLEDLENEEKRYPLDVAYCSACSLVQILKTVPPEELFCDDETRDTVDRRWGEYFPDGQEQGDSDRGHLD